MNGLEFAAYVAPMPMMCPVCKDVHDTFTGIQRAREDIQHHPRIYETIPPRILGWVLPCGCVLSVAEWNWVAAAGIPPRWVRTTSTQAAQGIMIGDGGTQTNTFN